MAGPHYDSSTWWPLYAFPHENLWVVRETGPNIVDDIALFELVRGGTEDNDPRRGEAVSTLNIVLANLEQPGWNINPQLGATVHGPSKLYSEYWLGFLHDMVLPPEVRVAKGRFWGDFEVPHFVDDLVLQRMQTEVPPHVATFRNAWDKLKALEAKIGESRVYELVDKIGKAQNNLTEMMAHIVELPFAKPVRHRIRRDVTDIEQDFTYRYSIDAWLTGLIVYNPSTDTWQIFRQHGEGWSNPRLLATGDDLAEAWESAMEFIVEHGEPVLQDSEYDRWVDGLEHGDELVDLSIYRALAAGNPILWREPQFVQWMKTLGGIEGVPGV